MLRRVAVTAAHKTTDIQMAVAALRDSCSRLLGGAMKSISGVSS